MGYLKLNINDAQTEKMGDAYLEVQRIYFDENYQGGGRGHRLIDLAIKKHMNMTKLKFG